jgi:hypothetical protein
MRIGRALVLIAAVLAPTTAPAQQIRELVVAPVPPPVNQEGMQSFCIYANQVYSLGAQICVPGSNISIRCGSSEGSKSGGRAFWNYDSKEWPNAPGGRCEPK